MELNVFPFEKDLGIVPGAKWLPHFTPEGQEGVRKDFLMENQALSALEQAALGSSETPGSVQQTTGHGTQ